MRYISIKFNGYGRHYTYKAEDLSIMKDDYVVVHNQASNECQVVQVVYVHPEDFKEDPKINYVWVVQRVDFTMYMHRTNEDRAALDEQRVDDQIKHFEADRKERL